jgi:folate-binding Fe-S cluster repair protein YgfZ
MGADWAGRGVHALYNPATGRVLYDMMMWAHPSPNPAGDRGGGSRVILECDLATLPALQQRLLAFRLRADVEVEDVSEHWAVCAVLGNARPPARCAAATLDPRCAQVRALTSLHSLPPPHYWAPGPHCF